MKTFKVVIEDSQGNKAKVDVKAKTLEDAVRKVKGFNPEMSHKVYGLVGVEEKS